MDETLEPEPGTAQPPRPPRAPRPRRAPEAPASTLPQLDLVDVSGSCVARVPLFRQLSPQDQARVGALAAPTRLERGELLHGAGEAVARLFVVHRGRVKLVRAHADGGQRVIRVAGPGEVVGEHALLTGERPGYFVEALEDTSLCTFSHADLAALLRRHPAVAIQLLRTLSARLDEVERALTLAAVDVPSRLAAHLLELPVERTSVGLAVQWSMSKKDTASYLGTTPESLSRALARLQVQGLVRTDRGTTHLLDLDGLQALSDRAVPTSVSATTRSPSAPRRSGPRPG